MSARVPPTLVIGSGGLLGRGLQRAAARRGDGVLTQRVAWSDQDQAHDDLAIGFEHLLQAAGDGPWRLMWCAGVGVTSSSPDALQAELTTLKGFLKTISQRAAGKLEGGTIFLASSAGGVYAGASDPPFTENTSPRPLAAYGQAKLDAEALVAGFCQETGSRSFIARIANLYGPGQDTRKPQGLITHLCRSSATGQPVGLYVSLDTLRDYIYVDDCAEMILDAMNHLESGSGSRAGESVTKIIASQKSVSIGALIAETRRVFGHRPRVLIAASPHAAVQARDLRLRSVQWPELDRRVLTPLPVGISITSEDINRRMRLSGAGGV